MIDKIKDNIKCSLKEIVTHLLIDWKADRIYEEFTYVQSMASYVCEVIDSCEKQGTKTRLLMEEFCAAVYISSQHMIAITQKKMELAQKIMMIMDIFEEETALAS